MAKSVKSGAKSKQAAPKSQLSAKAMKRIKGGDTKTKTPTPTPTPTPTRKGLFEIDDFSFDITQT